MCFKQNDCQHFLYNTPSMYSLVCIIGYVHYCRVTALGGVMHPRQINPSADGGKINPLEKLTHRNVTHRHGKVTHNFIPVQTRL